MGAMSKSKANQKDKQFHPILMKFKDICEIGALKKQGKEKLGNWKKEMCKVGIPEKKIVPLKERYLMS